MKAQEVPYYNVTNFWQYVNTQTLYFDSIKIVRNGDMGGTGYKQFMRWLYKWQPIVTNDVSYDSSLSYQLKGLHKLTQEYVNAENKTENLPLVWKELGPITNPNNKCMGTGGYKRIKGPGRCSFVEFDRLNNQRIFTGSPTGGLFYSTNGGNNWKNGGTDYLPTPSISHFQIDSPSNTWFIATGDADAGFTTSYGIFRSTNEGTNWYPINNGLEILSPITNWWANQCRKILINPTNGNIMYGVFFTGIFKTTNALATNPQDVIWTKVCDGKFTDIQYKPNSNFQELYASGSSIYFSTNSGNNWNIIPNIQQINIQTDDLITIRVTAANSNSLYAAVVKEPSMAQLYKYNALSQTWSYAGPMNHPGHEDEYLPYGMGKSRAQSFVVSQIDENLMFRTHVQYIYKSTDGGINWLAISDDKHDDGHWLTYNLDGTALWIATDGGVNKSTNLGATWENKTNNIGVSNMFNIATGNTLFNQILYGGYDTGTSLFDGINWTQMNGFGDSFDCLIDDTDPQNPIYYMTNQNFFGRSDDGACIFNSKDMPYAIGSNGWEHRWVKDFHTQSTIYYAGNNRIGRTLNKMDTWSAISFNVKEDGIGLKAFRQFYGIWNSVNYNNYLYISSVGRYEDPEAFRLFKTTNCNVSNPANVTWVDATPVFNGQTIHKWIGDVSIDEENPDKIWVCYGGFRNDGGPKVMYFNGSTWEDMTGGYDNNSPLYGISACKIILQRNSDIVYLATTAGLYYKTNITNWTPLSGVPHCEVWDMDMNYFGNKLRIATRGRGLWETDIPCIYNSTPLEITSNQLWDIDKRLSSNVIIKNNATLTITSRISLPTDAKIIVEPGGKLIADGGTLTSGCSGDIWQGIEVLGNPNQMQNNPLYQGYVELKNGATIENAVIGVHCVLNGYIPAKNNVTYYSSGGIVVANGAIFRNNKTAINIERYASAYGLSYYVSNINGCIFEYPNLIPNADVETPTYIKLTGVKGVNISQNNFNGNINNLYYHRGIGIEAHDATFKSNSPAGVNPLPNVFTNLSYGIACYNTSTLAKPEILLSTFTDCWRAIYLSTVADAKVINNTINYKSQSTDPLAKAYGIYLDNCNGYQVEGNLLSSSSKVMSEYPENGIVVNNSGTTTNQIYRNSFTQIQVPVNAQNINRLPDGSIGLQLLCNNINECTVNDMVVTYDASQLYPNNCGIKTNQGRYIDPKVPAGNLFTKGGKVYKNYINATPNIVYYAHYSNDLITYQTNPHYLIPRILAVNSNMSNQNTVIQWTPERWVGTDCKDLTGLPGGGKSLNDVEGLKEQIDVLKPKIDSANTVLVQKMDHGNTTTLINRIATATPANYQTLYNDLRNYSPYLSEEVLLAVIHKQGFPSNMLVNLMLVNTHVAKTPLLMEALQQKQPPLPSGQIKQIANKINVFSVMEIDRMKISNMLTRRDYAYNTVESYYAHDSLVSSNDSLGEMLVRDPRLSAKYGLVYHYLANNDSTNADLLANQIPQLFSLDAQAQLEYNHYKQLYDLKRSLQREGKNFMDLSEAQQQMLINAINNPSMSTGKMNDLNALRQVAGMIVGNTKGKTLTINYNEPIIDPIENKEKNFDNTDVTGNEALLMEVLMDKVLMEQNNLQLYPNPASNMVNVLYNISSDAGKVSIEINDVTGKIISTYMVDKNSSQMIINTQSLNKGIYYVMLKVDNKSMKVEKLVIQ